MIAITSVSVSTALCGCLKAEFLVSNLSPACDRMPGTIGPLLVRQDRDAVPVLRRIGRKLSGERGEMRRRRVSVGKHLEGICRLGEGPAPP